MPSTASPADTPPPDTCPTRRSSDLDDLLEVLPDQVAVGPGAADLVIERQQVEGLGAGAAHDVLGQHVQRSDARRVPVELGLRDRLSRSEEHTSELQSRFELVCRPLLPLQTHLHPTLALHAALPISTTCSKSSQIRSR